MSVILQLLKILPLKLEANDVLPNINRMQAAERAENAIFVPGDLDLWPWPSNSSDRGTKHVFCVNLAQIRSAVPGIFHTQHKSSAVAEMSYHLAAVDMGQKGGAAVPLSRGGGWAPSNTMWSGLRPTSVPSGILINPAVWPQKTWAKKWGCLTVVSLFRGAGPPSSIMSPELASLPSGILIHPPVWPQQSWPKIWGC